MTLYNNQKKKALHRGKIIKKKLKNGLLKVFKDISET